MILFPHLQGSAEWLRWRTSGIGGSDAGVIMGVAPWPDATRWRLLRDKCQGRVHESNYAMRRGTRLEPIARNLYAVANSCSITSPCIRHDEIPWMLASLDGLCQHRGNSRQWLIEVKCPKWQDHSAALAGIVPMHYRPQCQHVLFASGLDRLDYVSFNDSSMFDAADHLAVVPVLLDAEYCAELLEEEEKFWQRVTRWRARKSNCASSSLSSSAV